VVTNFCHSVIVGHIGSVVARLIDGKLAGLLNGAVPLEPPLQTFEFNFKFTMIKFY